MLCSKAPWPPRDGGALAMLNMVRAFHKAGHEATVLTMNTPKHYLYLRNLPDRIQQQAEFFTVDVDTQVRFLDVIANFIFSKESYHVQRFTSGAFRSQLEDILMRKKFDVVQLETLYMTPYIATIREHAPESLISLRTHNIEHEIWQRRAQNENNPIKRYVFAETADRIKRYEEQEVYGRNPFDVLVPITGRDAGMLKKMGVSKPLHISPAGFDLENLATEDEDEENDEELIDVGPVETEYPSVAYLGAMDWEPNREGMDWFLKEVWPLVSAAFPDVKFYLAGRNMPERYYRMADESIEVVGEVPDAGRFLRSKAVVVVPVLSGSGMRVKIIEGMAHGRAVVATSLAAEGIGVSHGNQLFLADSPAEFAECVKVLIEQRALYDTISARAAEFIQAKYDNDQIIAQLLGFYRKHLKAPEQVD